MSTEDSISQFSDDVGYVVPESHNCFDVLQQLDAEVDDSQFIQDPINQKKDKKRKKGEDDEGKKKTVEEDEGLIVKKLKEEGARNFVKAEEKEDGKLTEAVTETIDEEICLPNLILGIYCPKYKTMPQYREKWKTSSEEMKELREMEEKKKNEEMKKLSYWKKLEEKK